MPTRNIPFLSDDFPQSSPQSSPQSAPRVVGTIHSEGSLRAALRLKPGAVDFLELRVDAFSEAPSLLLSAVPKLKFPLVVTVRHPLEGGAHSLSFSRRRELFLQFLPFASVLDLELRSVEKLESLLALARGQKTQILLSSHHFRSAPPASKLRELLALAQCFQPDIFKLAAQASSAADIGALLELFACKKRPALSVMGMGPLGKVSRLLFARAGSVLNYGYLDQPNASGQWEAVLLKKRLAELES